MFARLFEAVSDEPDMGYAMVDATIMKVHRHGQSVKGGTSSQAIGRSKGGMTAKILVLTDALGNLDDARVIWTGIEAYYEEGFSSRIPISSRVTTASVR
ncbi:hypothetical protein [Methylobacterium sp. J-068]|uniref:hypothetical protein n=1 Tax=Methylobacterium sp. J-068 TaxID=2836649 RepID=UPI001FBBD0FF|nr:hypothetical protein [Methylobacterium sp. J-068]MCJ2036590.1 hypothetical protein [Methylobacterium sp. J-068]